MRNRKAFPISQARFCDDLKKLGCKAALQMCRPGMVMEIFRGKAICRRKIRGIPQYRFNPAGPVPDLIGEYPAYEDRDLLEKSVHFFRSDFPNALTLARSLPDYAGVFESRHRLMIEIVGAKSARPHQMVFELNGSSLKTHRLASYDSKAKIHAAIFMRNMTAGAPFVALLDGIRLTGRTENQRSPLGADDHPLFFYFYLKSFPLDKIHALREARKI